MVNRMKDIFIDNNIAKNFSNPLDPEYQELVKWLMYCKESFLVTCKKLIMEYGRTNAASKSYTSIWAILDKITREGRRNHIPNEDIKEFKRHHYKTKIVNNMTCSIQDREFIPAVLLSNRKYALVRDDNFKCDLENFPGFNVLVEKRPQDIPYK